MLTRAENILSFFNLGLRSFVPLAIVPLLISSRDHSAASDWIYYTYSMIIIMTMEQAVYSYLVRRKIRKILGTEPYNEGTKIVIVSVSIIFTFVYCYFENWNPFEIALSLLIICVLSKTNDMKSNFEASKSP